MEETRKENKFFITILGRTLEHLGVQMYKQRNSAIAELLANSWDAGTNNVYLTIPSPENYNQQTSRIIIEDDGCGMDANAIENDYLVIGKNKRKDGGDEFKGRKVMGRKGIGKLAGFGIANVMTIQTWVNNISNTFSLDMDELKAGDGEANKVPIISIEREVPADAKNNSGTRITLEQLKHQSEIDITKVQNSLSRRFSKTIRGSMNIYINDTLLSEPDIEYEFIFPEDGHEYFQERLEDGNIVSYNYCFSKKPIPQTELRGFTIFVRGKTAQAPNFFFDMEGRARGQHGTKYITGVINADYLDEGTGDEDLISTDRQELDWENEQLIPLKHWGEKLIQKLLNQWMDLRGAKFESIVLQDGDLNKRIVRLDEPARKQVSKFLKILGQAETDTERARDLGDALVRAYEYKNFHDVVSQIESLEDNPDNLTSLLLFLYDWKALESRAILEIVKGRLEIIDKFFTLLIKDAAETAHRKGDNNLHDLLAEYPWLLNPEWQVLVEEKSISKTLQDWNAEDQKTPEDNIRYDFLALTDEGRTVVIEIKRSSHAVTYEELKRLETYKERLLAAKPNVYMVMLCSGNLNVSEDIKENWKNRKDGEIMAWNKLHEKIKSYYWHYKAVLEGDINHTDFINKEREVKKTRQIIESGTVFRGKDVRKIDGIGGQDVDYSKP